MLGHLVHKSQKISQRPNSKLILVIIIVWMFTDPHFDKKRWEIEIRNVELDIFRWFYNLTRILEHFENFQYNKSQWNGLTLIMYVVLHLTSSNQYLYKWLISPRKFYFSISGHFASFIIIGWLEIRALALTNCSQEIKVIIQKSVESLL